MTQPPDSPQDPPPNPVTLSAALQRRPPAKPRPRIKALPSADYRAALRYHVLRGVAEGRYESDAEAARALGVSRAWVCRVVG